MSQQVDLEELTRLYEKYNATPFNGGDRALFLVAISDAFPALRDELVRLRDRVQRAEDERDCAHNQAERLSTRSSTAETQLDEAKRDIQKIHEITNRNVFLNDCPDLLDDIGDIARALLASIAGTRDNNPVSSDYAKSFESLGRVIYDKVTGHVGCGESDEWCDDVMATACLLGLAKKEIYNPDKHGSLGYEPGVDSIFWWGHLPKHWRPVEFLDVSGNPQDPDKCGFLRINDMAAIAEQPTQGEVKS